jgi:nitrous-oxide reductase
MTLPAQEAAHVIRDGHKLRVYMTSNAPSYILDMFELDGGDEVSVAVEPGGTITAASG